MKRIRISMTAVVVAASLLVSFAFTGKGTGKPIFLVYYNYVRPNNVILSPDLYQIILSQLSDSSTASWQQWCAETHGSTVYLGQIAFDNNLLTLGQAVKGVRDFYALYQWLPADGMCVYARGIYGNYYPVTIYRQEPL